jgi:hypothetical protein
VGIGGLVAGKKGAAAASYPYEFVLGFVGTASGRGEGDAAGAADAAGGEDSGGGQLVAVDSVRWDFRLGAENKVGREKKGRRTYTIGETFHVGSGSGPEVDAATFALELDEGVAAAGAKMYVVVLVELCGAVAWVGQ